MNAARLLLLAGAVALPPLPNLMPVRTLTPPPPKGAVKLLQLAAEVKQQKLAALAAPKLIILSFDGSTGSAPYYYSVQQAPAVTGPWTEIGHLPPTNNGSYYLTNAPPAGTSFYRVGRLGF